MATLTADRALSTFPVAGFGAGGNLKVAWGIVTPSADPAPNDIFEMCRVPKGATVIGGFVQAEDLDTNASETFDIDAGWAANGTDSADPDGFGNFGVQTGDASVHMPVAGLYLPFANIIQSAGYKTFAAETVLTITCIDDTATFTAGVIKMVAFYTVP